MLSYSATGTGHGAGARRINIHERAAEAGGVIAVGPATGLSSLLLFAGDDTPGDEAAVDVITGDVMPPDVTVAAAAGGGVDGG